MRFGLCMVGIALLMPVAASAQSLESLAGDLTPFTISVDPQYPTPYSQATLSFLSSSINLANATMVVSVAGKKIYQGSVQPTSVTLGATGSVTTVMATITAGGTPYTQTVSIQPQDVTLVIEPVSSTPVLYQGKPSVPLEGDVRVVAMANLRGTSGKPIDPNTLSYAWTVDDTQIADSSGIGKESILVASPLQYRSRDVSVAVMNSSGSVVGGASFSLIASEPSVRLYENDPLMGIRFDHALSGTYNLNGSETTMVAVPFSLPTTTSAPVLQWFLNGASAQTGNSITLRPTGNGQGNAALSVVASAGESTTATANLSLIFGTQSSNFFGL